MTRETVGVERFFFETDAKDPSCQFVGNADEDTATISNNDDWCGDTESGFGATVSIQLTRDDARRLRDAIDAWLASTTARAQGGSGGD